MANTTRLLLSTITRKENVNILVTLTRARSVQKLLLESKIEGQRGGGTPRVTWMKNIKKWLGRSEQLEIRWQLNDDDDVTQYLYLQLRKGDDILIWSLDRLCNAPANSSSAHPPFWLAPTGKQTDEDSLVVGTWRLNSSTVSSIFSLIAYAYWGLDCMEPFSQLMGDWSRLRELHDYLRHRPFP